jgi:esterase/lipase superfamily enzyme
MHFTMAMLRNRAVGERRHLRAAFVIVLAVALAGCASRPGPEVLAPVGMTAGIRTVPIFVATTRKRAAPSENVFTTERADTLNFAKFVVGVPPHHQPGKIEWSNGAPDPRVSFVTIDQAVLSDAKFRNEVAPLSKITGRGKKHDVLIFVHGFNNNFQESLYRLAQISADSGYGASILFAWPSQANPLLYSEDKAAAAYSRDYLIELLTMVSDSPQVGEILLVAHSMGGMLTAEALRELRIQGRNRVIARLGRVVLAAPDIDAAVFRSQVQAIGPLKPPLTVLVSKDDTALKLSSFIGGSIVRAGALDIDNPLVQEAAVKAQVRVVDISQLQSPDGGMHHDRLFNFAVLYPQVQRRLAVDGQKFGVFLFDAATDRLVEVANRAN